MPRFLKSYFLSYTLLMSLILWYNFEMFRNFWDFQYFFCFGFVKKIRDLFIFFIFETFIYTFSLRIRLSRNWVRDNPSHRARSNFILNDTFSFSFGYINCNTILVCLSYSPLRRIAQFLYFGSGSPNTWQTTCLRLIELYFLNGF